MDIEIIAIIGTAVLGVVSTFLGTKKYKKYKDIAYSIWDAAKDGTITKKEIEDIYEKFKG